MKKKKEAKARVKGRGKPSIQAKTLQADDKTMTENFFHLALFHNLLTRIQSLDSAPNFSDIIKTQKNVILF
jgi:hypothetical protein